MSSQEATLRQKAIAAERQNNLVEAESAWSAITKSYPNNAEAYAHLGLLAARGGDYEKAIPLYRRALKLQPSMPGLRMNLGLALFKGLHSDAAIREFTILLNSPGLSSQNALRLQELIGMAHYGQGEYAAAIPFLKDAAAADTRNLELRLILAHSCLWAKQNQCVLDTYKQILTIDPDSAEAYILAGEAMDAMKNTVGAIEQFRLAIRANPRQLHAHFGLGYLLWTQKSYDEAAKEFQAELSLDPDHTLSQLYLADIYVKSSHFADARPLLERVEKADPSLSLVHLDMGIILTDTGQKQEAVKELEEASRLDPNNVDAHWRLGRLYRGMGRTEEAKAELEKARAINKKVDNDLSRMISDGAKRGDKNQTQPKTTSPEHNPDFSNP